MDTTEQKRDIPLSAEDRARMARLYEEVTGRVEEMALIVARTLGEDSQDHLEIAFVRRFVALSAQQAAASRFKGVEVIHFAGCGWGCYNHDAGTCSAC